MRKNRNAETRPTPAKKRSRPFNPYKLEAELARDADRRRERLAPNQFHIVRGIAEADEVIGLMPELDPVSKHAGKLAFSYFNSERRALNSKAANMALGALPQPSELEVPTIVRTRERSPVHLHVFLALGKQIKNHLTHDYKDISSGLTAEDQDLSLPMISGALGFIRLGRYRARHEAHEAKEMFAELLPPTLTITPPEVLHIPQGNVIRL